ncbi:MAG: hypothetical protein H5U05_10820 [Candidatus Aminicenantes bacterium]|nr:hypothetical protein [Candidatus Aminicenantes bacterium]
MPEIEGELKPCRNGYHVVTLEQLPDWLGERIFEVEPGDEIVHADNKSVTRTCRLTRECTGWNERTARLFACDCAERVLPLYEARYDDDRPRKAIETARRYAEGKADVEELAAARAAAWEAALNASRDASRAAAWAAAWAAVWAAEEAVWAAARAAAEDAAWAAAWAASLNASRAAALNASRYAARNAAEAAAGDAAWDAAWDAERNWQVERLRKILEVANNGDIS